MTGAQYNLISCLFFFVWYYIILLLCCLFKFSFLLILVGFYFSMFGRDARFTMQAAFCLPAFLFLLRPSSLFTNIVCKYTLREVLFFPNITPAFLFLLNHLLFFQILLPCFVCEGKRNVCFDSSLSYIIKVQGIQKLFCCQILFHLSCLEIYMH